MTGGSPRRLRACRMSVMTHIISPGLRRGMVVAVAVMLHLGAFWVAGRPVPGRGVAKDAVVWIEARIVGEESSAVRAAAGGDRGPASTSSARTVGGRFEPSTIRAQADHPDSPAVRPESRIARPGSQTVRPESQTARPESQTIRPESQTVRPGLPTARPESQTVRPGLPTVRPESQTVRPELVEGLAPASLPPATPPLDLTPEGLGRALGRARPAGDPTAAPQRWQGAAPEPFGRPAGPARLTESIGASGSRVTRVEGSWGAYCVRSPAPGRPPPAGAAPELALPTTCP